MAASVGIIDYQMGNLRSVQKAFERTGIEADIFCDPLQFSQYEKIVLPGVGAFRDAIAEIRSRQLDGPIKDWIAADKPFLGICLGLQMLFETSYEGGEYEGLGIIPGSVVQFEVPAEMKVPHMGWNQVTRAKNWGDYSQIQNGNYFYFVHSFYVKPDEPLDTVLTANYGDDFCAAVARGNLLATQFHPEKSQENGLQLLQEFGSRNVCSV